jgi:hypothetical protein
MSKANSGLFTLTMGANAIAAQISPSLEHAALKNDNRNIDPNKIRYSQTSVNGSSEIVESMRKDGWKGDPIDVVVMSDGELTTLDNTRVVAARIVGIKVEANVHNYNDPLPSRSMAERFATPKGGTPKTWGQAVENRIGKQSSGFRKNNPNGSYNMKKIK